MIIGRCTLPLILAKIQRKSENTNVFQNFSQYLIFYTFEYVD